MRRTLFTILLCSASAVAGAQAAQSKVSGVMKCTPGTDEAAGVGDQMITFAKSTCTWSTPMVIAGSKAATANNVEIGDVKGMHSSGHGYSTSIMDNGDTVVTRYEGMAQARKDGSATFKGTWKFAHGSGKFAGINGGGTYSGTGDNNGGTVNVTGHYVISSGKGKKGS